MEHRIEILGGVGRLVPVRFDASLQGVARSLPGHRRWHKGILTFEPTYHNFKVLERDLPNAVWTEDARKVYEEGLAKRAADEARRDAPPDAEDMLLPFVRKPYDHQLRAFSMSKTAPAFGYFMDMGTGKTKLTIDVGCWLFLCGHIRQMFILAPNGVDEQWIREQIPTHLWRGIPHKVLELSTASLRNAKLRREMEAVLSFDGLRVFALNTEALSHASGLEVLMTALKNDPTMLVADELSRFKNPTAARTKNLLKAKVHAPFRRGLTGTPVSKGVEDLYAQLKFIDERILGSASFVAFRNEFCILGGWQNKEVVGYRNLERLQELIRPYVFHIRKEDCLDLPPKVYVQREFRLAEDERKIAQELKEELLLDLDGLPGEQPITLMPPHAAARAMKLRQISQGFLYGDERSVVWRAAKPGRVSALEEVLAEIGDQQAIVWGHFHEDIYNILGATKNLGLSSVPYFGLLDNDERRKSMLDFRAGKAQVFVGQSTMGGLGLELQNASVMIYYAQTSDAEVRWQSEDRAHRIGQTKSLTVVDLMGRGTGDRKAWAAVQNRDRVARLTLDELRDGLQEDL
jgi:hypothetical protein